MRATLLCACVVAGACFSPIAASAEEPRPPRRSILPASFLDSPPNVATPTLGGTQFWGDELYYGQWRIQRNAVTGHYRLLSPDDVRRAWGNRATCERQLEESKRTQHLQPLRGKVVIVLHGLMGSRVWMMPLANAVAEGGEYQVINLTYPSTRASVADHAASLGDIVSHLDEAQEINFVAHSLGNLVVRRYMHDYAEAHHGKPDPRVNRFVMIGPPNHGARCAIMLGGNCVFNSTLGESAEQLGHRWNELEPTLATPCCEFGIIAGGTENEHGFNPLLEGDDDETVRVAEARLAGAADFTLVHAHHGWLPMSPIVQEQALRYLHTGSFRENGERQPIEAKDEN